MVNSKICHYYPIHLQDITNLMMVSSWKMEHTPSDGCNENMIALINLILVQLVLKLVRKLKASF